MTKLKKLTEKEEAALIQRIKDHSEKYLFSRSKTVSKNKDKKKD